MKNEKIHSMWKAAIIFFLTPVLLTFFCQINCAFSASNSFPVFDALLYKNKPDMSGYGLSPIKMVYQGALWNPGESHGQPNLSKLATVAKSLDPLIVTCIDIEDWNVSGNPIEVQHSIGKYLQVVNFTKATNSKVKIGFYGVLPIRDIWRANKSKGIKQYDVWVRQNQKLAPIASKVDVIFPSLYTFYNDPQGWVKYAIANLKEAKKYGKPVYAFIWPMFHDSTPLKGQYIPADFWRLQLDTCRKYADGIVIWGGYNDKVLDWDPKAPWWNETTNFMNGLK